MRAQNTAVPLRLAHVLGMLALALPGCLLVEPPSALRHASESAGNGAGGTSGGDGVGGDAGSGAASGDGASGATSESGGTSAGGTSAGGSAGKTGSAGMGGSGVVSLCGNGTVETGEGCDDGNTMAGDGCSPRRATGAAMAWPPRAARMGLRTAAGPTWWWAARSTGATTASPRATRARAPRRR